MTDYEQPEFYRFSSDSLALVNWVAGRRPTSTAVLDLGAGCGIIGIELARLLGPRTLTLLEGQAEFLPYLEANLRRFLPAGTEAAVVNALFRDWTPARRYDLIVSNPPYYLPESGVPSRDERRGMARSFVQDGWPGFLRVIARALGPAGVAFVVLKTEPRLLALVETEANLAELALTIHPEGAVSVLELARLQED